MVIDAELKELYKQDNVPKSFTVTFPSISLTITNDKMVKDSFSLEESLFSDDNIALGSCESSKVSFTVADVIQDLKGMEFTITQTVGAYSISLGSYIVESCKKQDDLRFKDIVAYDNMAKFDADVASWYNALTFPLSLKTFRNLLCNHIGVEYEDSNLLNDAMQVTKTIDPNVLIGRQVLIASEEINGAFGHIGRNGVLQHIVLNNTPKETYKKSMYAKILFEEYTVKAIDSIQIRQEEGDIGAFVGGTTNTYIVQGNFLAYGKSPEELAIIANNILTTAGNKSYRPFIANAIGLPYVEVGDCVNFETADAVTTYVMQRNLKGIQSLQDELSASGAEHIEGETSGINEEIIQLKGKSAILKRTVEELNNTIANVEEGLTSEIQQTADEINLRISQVEKIYDSAAESTQGDGIPTLENYPAMNWTDEVYPGIDQYPSEIETWTYSAVTYDKHLGTVYYDNANQKAYRFTLIDGVYQFKEITDALTATIIDKISSLEMTTDSIETEVTAIETKVNNDLYTKTETQSLVAQTATGITQTVSSTYETKSNASSTKETLQSQIAQTATSIELKVDKNGVIGAINLTSEAAKISAAHINLEGYVTVTALGQPGATIINGSNIKTGTIDASLVNVVNLKADNITAGTFSGDRISGGIITGVTINGATIYSTGAGNTTTISGGTINSTYINMQQGNSYTTMYAGIATFSNGSSQTSISPTSVSSPSFNGFASNARVLSYSLYSNKYAYVTANDNMVATSSDMYIGSSGAYWAGVYAMNGTIITSDERLKDDIKELDERFLRFARMVVPYTYRMINGTSGRYHIGFIAQKVEKAMIECGITDMEFAGLIKSPVYAVRLFGGEYDTNSEIIDYSYALRYDEFIPLVFLWMKDLEGKLNTFIS